MTVAQNVYDRLGAAESASPVVRRTHDRDACALPPRRCSAPVPTAPLPGRLSAQVSEWASDSESQGADRG